jgi:hypothetical protein
MDALDKIFVDRLKESVYCFAASSLHVILAGPVVISSGGKMAVVLTNLST